MRACSHDRQEEVQAVVSIRQDYTYMRQGSVYKLFVDGLCTYQAFCSICCKQAGNKFTTFSGLDKQLLVKLGGWDTSMPNVVTISSKLAVC